MSLSTDPIGPRSGDDSEIESPVVIGGGRLLLSPSNQSNQSNQGYYSIRLTIEHAWWSKIYSHLLMDKSYVAAPHTGSETEKQHWHLVIPGPSGDDQIYRNAINRKLSLKGNGLYQLKYMKNPIVEAITYLKHEPGVVLKFSPDMQAYVDSAPDWVDFRQSRMEEHVDMERRRRVRDWQLTYSNLVPQAVEHRRQFKLPTDCLKVVVKHMLETSKWCPSIQMIRQGVPEFYDLRFKHQIGVRKDADMSWWTPRF